MPRPAATNIFLPRGESAADFFAGGMGFSFLCRVFVLEHAGRGLVLEGVLPDIHLPCSVEKQRIRMAQQGKRRPLYQPLFHRKPARLLVELREPHHVPRALYVGLPDEVAPDAHQKSAAQELRRGERGEAGAPCIEREYRVGASSLRQEPQEIREVPHPPRQRALKPRPRAKLDRSAPAQLVAELLGVLGRTADLGRVDAGRDEDGHREAACA